MKTKNKFKIMTSFAFLIIIFVTFFYFKSKNYDRTLRVAVNLDGLVFPIDPANNATLTNAFFSNNLYSNLIEVDEYNNYKLDLASKYWFDRRSKRIYFEFEKSRVTAEDAAFTLKRILLQNKQHHADFFNVICNPSESRNSCARNINNDKNRLVIKYVDEAKSKYIIPILASVDYKIVPLAAFDSSDYKIANIKDYTKTSGYYYLIKKNGNYFFVRNSNLLNDNIFKNWELVNIREIDLKENPQIENLIDTIDVISTVVLLTDYSYEKLLSKNWNFFESHKISVQLLVFSAKAMKKTNPDERFNIASRINEEVAKKISLAKSQETIEFFQKYGQGFLNGDQYKEIKNLRSQAAQITNKTLALGVKRPELWKDLVKNNKDIKLLKVNENYASNKEIDIYSVTNDVSFDLSLSVISYAAKNGLLDISESELKEFTNLSTEKNQISFINKVHFRTIKNCKIFPLRARSYITAFNGKFINELSKFNSRTLLWKIH